MTLRDHIIKTIDAVIEHYFDDLPLDAVLLATKTESLIARVRVKALQDYDNTLTRIISIYINDLMTHPGGADFAVEFAAAIDAGLNEAWRLGLRENDAEMTEEWQEIVDGIIAEERSHIPDLAEYITEVVGRAESIGDAITQARNRLSMWITRYTDVYNQAILASAEEKTKMMWIYGDTDHCSTCAALNGLVAYAREWDEAGLHPQSPPNERLECGGWKCQCELVPTDERRSRNIAERLASIAG